ncbi:hypothetical protein BaRGS_00008804, partial [Batillaria attramentaria]
MPGNLLMSKSSEIALPHGKDARAVLPPTDNEMRLDDSIVNGETTKVRGGETGNTVRIPDRTNNRTGVVRTLCPELTGVAVTLANAGEQSLCG